MRLFGVLFGFSWKFNRLVNAEEVYGWIYDFIIRNMNQTIPFAFSLSLFPFLSWSPHSFHFHRGDVGNIYTSIYRRWSQYTKMPVHIFEYVNLFSSPERYAFDRKNNVGNSHEKRKHMIIWTDYCVPISLRNEAYFREREKTNQFH